MTTVNLQVSASADDAQEAGGGTPSLTDATIATDVTTKWLGFRFQNVAIDQGATITAATATFHLPSSGLDEPDHPIYGEDADNAAAFTTGFHNITDRPRTTATVTWSNTNLGAPGSFSPPDLAAIIQEIVDRPGWANGNALVLLIRGSADSLRDLEVTAYDGTPANAAQLVIDFVEDPMPKRIGATYEVQGIPVNGATAKVWSGLSATPAKDTAIASLAGLGGVQVGGSILTSTSFGGDGAYEFDNLAAGEYHVSVEYGGHIVYQAAARALLPAQDETVSGAWTFSQAITAPGLTKAGTMTIGATGANQILLQTNGSTRLTISSAGAATFAGALTAGGLLTVSAGGASITGATAIVGAITQTGGGATALSGTLTVTGASTLNGHLTLSLANARWIMQDTGGGADAKRWDMTVSSNTLLGRVINDADSASVTWLTVSRSGATLTSITFGGFTRVSRAASSDNAWAALVSGDTAMRFLMTAGGVMAWGPGGASAQDVTLERSSAAVAKVTGQLWVTSGLRVFSKAGTISDADLTNPAGAMFMGIDEASGRTWWRYSDGTTHYGTLT